MQQTNTELESLYVQFYLQALHATLKGMEDVVANRILSPSMVTTHHHCMQDSYKVSGG